MVGGSCRQRTDCVVGLPIAANRFLDAGLARCSQRASTGPSEPGGQQDGGGEQTPRPRDTGTPHREIELSISNLLQLLQEVSPD